MKRNCAFILILIFVVCLAFCACDDTKTSPWGDKNVENNGSDKDNGSVTKTYKIYVYGAVENEGYYEVEEGATYLEAIIQAGLLECSWLPASANSVVDEKQSSIVVQYLENGVVHDCINANWEYFYLRLPREGLSDAVVNKIADYLDVHDKIPNKTVLLEVLGEDYENYHYKLYIAEADYEEAD